MINVLVIILFMGSIYGFINLVADIINVVYSLILEIKRKKTEKELIKALDEIVVIFSEHEKRQRGKQEE